MPTSTDPAPPAVRGRRRARPPAPSSGCWVSPWGSPPRWRWWRPRWATRGTRQRAEQNYLAAVAWEREAKAAQRSAAEQAAEIERLQNEIGELQRQINVLVVERDAATTRADGLQALLDDANRRLAEAEQRLAELAGTSARAGDQAILSR
ncbi:MAG: hypothetical protein R2755_11005 [Acidimicrobiales bacterium]